MVQALRSIDSGGKLLTARVLNGLTVAQLRELARKNNISIPNEYQSAVEVRTFIKVQLTTTSARIYKRSK
jgi:hypothetical protein